MTETEFDQTARLWLEGGPTALSDRALQAALDEIHVTRQRRAWGPARRQPDMNNNLVRLGLAAAAAVALAVVGINLLTTGDRVGGLGPSTAPSPTPSAPASPVALHNGPLEPGTYVIGPDLKPTTMECGLGEPEQQTPECSNTMRLMFTVPDGWAGAGDSIWLEQERNFGPAGAGMLFNRGGWLRSDPCIPNEADAAPVDIPVGPTAADFVR